VSSVNIVAHNLQGMFTNRQLGIVNTDKKKSSEKLSTGYKINRAADDAAGLSISEKMRKHIRGLNQGSKNISDGVNYCQIADGAMAEINEMLARMKVLAIKSANGTMSSSDRADTNNEIQRLKEETDRVFKTTKFNERFIWRQNNTAATQVESIETVRKRSISIPSQALYLDVTNENKTAWPATGVSSSGTGIISVAADPDQGIQFSWTGMNGKTYKSDKIAWPDDPLTGRTIHMKDYLSTEKAKADYTAGELDGIDAVLSYGVDKDITTFDELVQKLNTVRYSTSVGTSNNIELYNSSGNVISGSTTTANGQSVSQPQASINLYWPAVVQSDRDLNNTSDTSFAKPSNGGSITNFNVISKPTGSGPGTWTGDFTFEFTFDNMTRVTATARKSVTYALNTLDEADRDTRDFLNGGVRPSGDRWWGWNYTSYSDGRKVPYQSGHSRTESSDNVMNSVGESLHDTGGGTYKYGLLDDMSHGSGGYQRGSITLSFDLKSDSPYQIKSPDGGTSGLSTSSVGTMTLTVYTVEGETRQNVIDRIMQISGADIFSSGNSRNSDSGVVGSNSASVASRLNDTYKDIEEETYGPVRDEKGRPVYVFEDEKVDIHTEDMNNNDVIIPLEYKCLNNYVLGIDDMDTKSVETSRNAIGLIDSAARIVSEQRSLFGAYQNRLEHAALINDNTAENTTAAESLIRDTDMASEMVKFSKSNILSQAGQSLLAQTNQSNQGILSLLE